MASDFITRVEHGKDEPYTVIFRTDDADKYKHIEDECRRMFGHDKPTVDAVPVEWIKRYIEQHENAMKSADGIDFFIEQSKAKRVADMLNEYRDGERKDNENH